MIAPILPGIVSRSAIGTILTAQYTAVVVGQIVVGILADIFGRRRTIVGVMIFDAIMFAATGLTKEVTIILILRTMAGLAAPVALGISYVAAVNRDLPLARARFNFVLVGLSFNIGAAIGAATGGLLGAESWLEANLVAGAVPCVVAVWAAISEDTAEDRELRRRRAKRPVASAPVPGVATAAAGAPTLATAEVDAAAAVPSAAEEPSVGVPTPPSGLSQLIRSRELASVLLGFSSCGLTMGSFFSLMPVIVADLFSAATLGANVTLAADAALGTGGGSSPMLPPPSAPPTVTSASLGEGEEPIASAEAVQAIAVVILVSGITQGVTNLFGVLPSLQRFGSLGHNAWCQGMTAILQIAALVILGSGTATPGAPPTSTLIVALGAVLGCTYITGGMTLTVLNQSGTGYAKRFGAPIGTTTGICRSVYAAFFGIAPAFSIGLYSWVPWLPLALLAAIAALASVIFAGMKVAQASDPVPPAPSKRSTTATSEGAAANAT